MCFSFNVESFQCNPTPVCKHQKNLLLECTVVVLTLTLTRSHSLDSKLSRQSLECVCVCVYKKDGMGSSAFCGNRKDASRHCGV